MRLSLVYFVTDSSRRFFFLLLYINIYVTRFASQSRLGIICTLDDLLLLFSRVLIYTFISAAIISISSGKNNNNNNINRWWKFCRWPRAQYGNVDDVKRINQETSRRIATFFSAQRRSNQCRADLRVKH